tara:strand:+ start:75229 stop:75492 length:264 start_codon:yes stop_codon:yes gene_type:complete
LELLEGIHLISATFPNFLLKEAFEVIFYYRIVQIFPVYFLEIYPCQFQLYLLWTQSSLFLQFILKNGESCNFLALLISRVTLFEKSK